jgi:hypothetical protein
MEAVARSARFFVAELVSSGGGVPRSAATERLPSLRSRIHGSDMCINSLPDLVWPWILLLFKMMKTVFRCSVSSPTFLGVGSTDLVLDDFSTTRGCILYPTI